jgi:hypothetical protein
MPVVDTRYLFEEDLAHPERAETAMAMIGATATTTTTAAAMVRASFAEMRACILLLQEWHAADATEVPGIHVECAGVRAGRVDVPEEQVILPGGTEGRVQGVNPGTDPSAAMKGERGRPLGKQSKGPLTWEPGPVAPDWRSFSPKLLTSSEGIHMILSPCNPGWWAEANDDATLGFQVKTSMGGFVLAGKRGTADLAITSKAGERAVALVKEKSVTFHDGAAFQILVKGGVPLLGRRRHEFANGDGLQFRKDNKNRIWLTDATDRAHVLLLIAVDRFLQETDRS